MKDRYVVSRMTKEEIPIAIEWAAKVGWNPGRHDAECFYQADPKGFFAGKLNGKIIAIGAAVIYDDTFAFCGLYMVDERYRGKGYGLALTKERLAYIGKRNAGLDGVTNMLDKYARLGYKVAHNNARYSGEPHLVIKKNDCLISITHINFDELIAYDRNHFPAARTAFLRCWITRGEGIGYVQNGKLCGYGVIRECQQGFKIGPLFADSPAIANELFIHLAARAQGQPIHLDIPENNLHAHDLVKRYQLKKVFETARMYLKSSPQLPMEEIYGITTFELG
jgi:GNAT superfamily N-acetyltransferase